MEVKSLCWHHKLPVLCVNYISVKVGGEETPKHDVCGISKPIPPGLINTAPNDEYFLGMLSPDAPKFSVHTLLSHKFSVHTLLSYAAVKQGIVISETKKGEDTHMSKRTCKSLTGYIQLLVQTKYTLHCF